MAVAGSAALVYHIAILPRLIKTLQARHSQKLAQLERLSKLATSASNLENHGLDTAQTVEAQSNWEPKSIEGYKSRDGDKTCRDLVRSILHSSGESQLSAEDIISKAKEAFPESGDDPDLERCIRRELSQTRFFSRSVPEYDSADPDAEPKPSPVYSMISPRTQEENLDSAMGRLDTVTFAHKELLSESSPIASSAAQKTLQSLTELTALISGEMYSLPSGFRGSFASLNNRPQTTLGPAEEEVRRELRSLKGLLLNRCVDGRLHTLVRSLIYPHRRTFASVASARTASLPPTPSRTT